MRLIDADALKDKCYIAVDWNEQQARNFADMLHNVTQLGGDTK